MNKKNIILNINQHFDKYPNTDYYNYISDLDFNDIKDINLFEIKDESYWDGIVINEKILISKYDIYFLEIKKIDDLHIILKLSQFIDPWKWNIEFFCKEFEMLSKNLLDDSEIINVMPAGDDANYVFEFEFYLSEISNFKTVKKVLNYCHKRIDSIYTQILQKLNFKFIEEDLSSKLVYLKFDFPKHFRGICKQYLSYFGKFLYDNDIDCELNLVDKDDITYMTINIDESQIDIEQLKQALVGYFTLPIVAQENINFDTYDIATQQLIANIEHLKSQLRLANLMIKQYENNSLATSPKPVEYVLIDSLDEESKVKLFDGLVEIGKTAKFKFFGIEIGFSIPKVIGKFKKSSEDIN